MNVPLILALAWLGLLVLGANVGASVPNGFGLVLSV
jgi:hypothetical protein